MKQELKSAQTKQLILEEAFHLFHRKGFQSTSLDKVLAATRLTKGAFYHHFQNKHELALEVISTKVKAWLYEGLIAPLYEQEEPIKLLKQVFTQRLNAFSWEIKQIGCPVNNLMNEIGDKEAAYQRALRQIMEEWKAALINLLEKGKKSGSLNAEIDSESVAVYLMAAYEGVKGIRKLYNDDQVLEQYLTALQDYIDRLR